MITYPSYLKVGRRVFINNKIESMNNTQQRKVVICNFGEWGFMDRSNPSHASCYDSQAEMIVEHLNKKGIPVTVLLNKPETFKGYDGAIFITKGEIDTAREVKKCYPEMVVIVLTADPFVEYSGVVVLDKDFSGCFLSAIAEKFL